MDVITSGEVGPELEQYVNGLLDRIRELQEAERKALSLAGLRLTATKNLTANIRQLETREARLLKALDYYACIDHYISDSPYLTPIVMDDKGKRARAALEAK